MKCKWYVLLSVIAIFNTSFISDNPWILLLDSHLSKWGTYLSYRHNTNYKGDAPIDAIGRPVQPVGYGKNEANVFSVLIQNGEPVLRISGEIYGCVFTKATYQNYHLKLQVKFGDKKWPPRIHEPKDSGVLYHSQGEAGVDYWRSWMQAQEFQIMEGGFGDYWCVAKVGARVKMHNPAANNDKGVYDINGIETPMGAGGTRSGFVQHNLDFEKKGQWNTIELICFGDKSIHIVNGHVVMALNKMVYADGDELKPLTKGKIQLQSEAAEVFYKDIRIKNIDEVPSEYASWFK